MKPFLFSSLLFLLLPLCSGAQQPAITPRGMALPVVNMEEVETTPVGTRVGEVSVTDVSGRNWQLNRLRGKVVFLYCFSVDSAINSNTAAELNELVEKFADSAAVFLALSPERFSEMAQCGGNAFLKCPVAYQQGEALEKLAVTTFPAVVVLNKKGRIAVWQEATHSGIIKEQEALLYKLLQK